MINVAASHAHGGALGGRHRPMMRLLRRPSRSAAPAQQGATNEDTGSI
jgi:hypothetical protein